jgi:hypothetical protein
MGKGLLGGGWLVLGRPKAGITVELLNDGTLFKFQLKNSPRGRGTWPTGPARPSGFGEIRERGARGVAWNSPRIFLQGQDGLPAASTVLKISRQKILIALTI